MLHQKYIQTVKVCLIPQFIFISIPNVQYTIHIYYIL